MWYLDVGAVDPDDHPPQPQRDLVQVLLFRVSGLGLRVSGFGFRVSRSGFKVWGGVPGLGIRVSG